MQPVSLVSMVTKVASCAGQDNKERCIVEGVECLVGSSRRVQQCSGHVKNSIRFLRNNNLALTLPDKEGGFVVMEKDLFKEKAVNALKNNFVFAQDNPAKVKREALCLCDELKVPNLRKEIAGTKTDTLEVFYTAKTNRDSVPFRAIVTKKGSWQGALPRFLQKQLNGLKLGVPFLVCNSEEVRFYFSEREVIGNGLFAFSIDVEELFYSVPKSGMLSAVQESIDASGVVLFQNSTGMSASSFTALLDFICHPHWSDLKIGW